MVEDSGDDSTTKNEILNTIDKLKEIVDGCNLNLIHDDIEYLILKYTNYLKKLKELEIRPGYYISCRGDRYGSNNVPWIVAIFMCRLEGIPLYHNCSRKCKCWWKNLTHKYLLKNCYVTNDVGLISNDLNNNEKRVWAPELISKILYNKYKKSLPDLFHGSAVYHEVNKMYEDHFKVVRESGQNEVIEKVSSGCLIHVRLDDVWNTHARKGDKQGFIGQKYLKALIKKAHKRFNLPIYLLTTPSEKDRNICIECLSDCITDLGLPEDTDMEEYVLGSENLEFDIFTMIKSKELIISRSNFTFLPSLLHKNTVYTYTYWKHYWDLIGGDKDIVCNKIQLF
jgi:hypothetical protein